MAVAKSVRRRSPLSVNSIRRSDHGPADDASGAMAAFFIQLFISR